MCCFSRAVERVVDTNLFARLVNPQVQVLVYQMNFAAREPVAMILPLPVAPEYRERAVRFRNMKAYPDFFKGLASAFPASSANRTSGGYGGGGGAGGPVPLPVYEVGDFTASYVPAVEQFDRLDPRFRLPEATWQHLPGYADYGFAVFQLKPGRKMTTVHPMALEFYTREPDTLFFPTVHIHDGKVHEREHFDHALYCQSGGKDPRGLSISEGTAERFVDLRLAQGIVAGGRRLFRREMRGTYDNTDVRVFLI
jgi:hypothetical protein